MTRKKVTLAYITNDSERRASFKKRKKGLIKKVSELSTLCGVDACAIIYSQFEAEPEVWPSRLGAQAVLARFRKMSVMDQSRKMVNQESFTRQRIKKVEDQLRRVSKENKRKEMERFMYNCFHGVEKVESFNAADAADMNFVINQTLMEIRTAMDKLKSNEQMGMQVQMQQNVAPPPPPPPPLMLPPPPPPAVEAPPMVVNYEFPTFQLEEAPMLMGNVEELDGFPWNLIQSPPCAQLGGLGWDDRRMLPYYVDEKGNGGGGGGGGGGNSGTNHGDVGAFTFGTNYQNGGGIFYQN